jgi:hypothetical protein
MSEIDQNIPNNTPKPTKLDKAIDLVVSQDPGMPKGEIANRVIDIGAAKHKESVFRRLRKRDYKHGEISTIRDYNRQYLDRLIVPKALKVMDKAIKADDISDKDKYPYVKLAIDKSFGEIRHNEQPQVVRIDSINKAQILVKNIIDKD